MAVQDIAYVVLSKNIKNMIMLNFSDMKSKLLLKQAVE